MSVQKRNCGTARKFHQLVFILMTGDNQGKAFSRVLKESVFNRKEFEYTYLFGQLDDFVRQTPGGISNQMIKLLER